MSSTILLLCSLFFVHIALVLYSIGVWKIFVSKLLQTGHLWYFWIGFIADAAGTFFMGLLAKGIVYNIHTIVGFSALFFMFLHAMSATYILRKNNTSYMKIYYRVSMVAWIFWIGSYFTGIMAHH